jgi:signal peptidase I
MDIDFPFVLTWAVLICGAIWLFDVLVLKPRRVAELADGEEDKEPIIVEYAHSFFPVLLFVLVLRSFLAEPYQIPSGSMIPTLEVGDFILVNKYAYGIRLPVLGTKIIDVGEPEQGDVMVFVPPHDSRYFIKRVIGLPGDRVRYENKTLYINGERQGYEFLGEVLPGVRRYDETVEGHTHTTHRFAGVNRVHPNWLARGQEIEVPEGHYFMMGDNRDNSDDSRVWGLASEAKIVGKAVAIWLHKDPGLSMPTFARNSWLE